jgi:hypothetical protein
MNSPTEYIRRNNVHRWFHVWSLLLSVKKPDSFIDGKCTQNKKYSRWKYTDEIILSVFLLRNHRRTNDVGDCGICSKYFTTFCKILMD